MSVGTAMIAAQPVTFLAVTFQPVGGEVIVFSSLRPGSPASGVHQGDLVT
jgi:hypothetical protein